MEFSWECGSTCLQVSLRRMCDLEYMQHSLEKSVQSFKSIKYKIKIKISVRYRDVTNQTLPSREKFYYSWPGRVWFLTSRLVTGKSLTFFYSVSSSGRSQGTTLPASEYSVCSYC